MKKETLLKLKKNLPITTLLLGSINGINANKVNTYAQSNKEVNTIDNRLYDIDEIISYYSKVFSLDEKIVKDKLYDMTNNFHSAGWQHGYCINNVFYDDKEFAILTTIRDIYNNPENYDLDSSVRTNEVYEPDMEIEEAVSIANELITRANMCFTPDNLEFLRAGGRVSNVAFLGASILGLHPCIELIDGKLMATKKFRGKMKKVAPQLIKEYVDNYQLDRKETLWVIYTIGLSEEVKNLAKEAIAECGFTKTEWVQAHGVITTHGGPSAFGIAGFSVK